MKSQGHIIRSAIKLFGERGYEATSLKDIGADAGYAAGLITHHFKTKAALFLLCGLTVLDEMHDWLEAHSKDSGNGLNVVLAYYGAFIRYALERRSEYLVIVKLSPFSVSRPELSSEDIVWKMGRIIRLLRNGIEAGIRDGSLAPLLSEDVQVDLDSYSLTVFSVIMGAARTIAVSPFAPDCLQATTEVFLRSALAAQRS